MVTTSFKKIISKLCSISAPSGYECCIISYLKRELQLFADLDIKEDILGNLIVVKKGITNKITMLVAHCDEIGLSVKYIDEFGFIRFSSIGGVDLSLLKGCNVTIIHNEDFVNGVIGVKPVHLTKNNKFGKEQEAGELWIDIGAKGKENALQMVSVGDVVTFKANFTELNNHLFSSKSIDNRISVAILLSVLEKIKDVETKNNIAFVFSVQEEIGLRGAITAGYNVHPDICIAIDVTHATDYPSINKNIHGDVRVGMGPVVPIGANFNRHVQNQLRELAEKNRIQYQIESVPSHSGTDLAELQLTNGGCATGLISIPCRYMHTPIEVASYEDIYKAIKLLQDFVCLNN